MPLRPPAGFIRPGYDPLKVPDAPTIGTATGGDAQASVAFTAPSNVGGSAISAYYAVSNPGQITSSGASSPVTVTGLTNGTSYTFTVWALNTYGPSPYSAASGSVSPAAAIALFAGGERSGTGNTNLISYITISTLGNATYFGDLLAARREFAGCSSTSRGVFAGSNNNVIQYVTFSSAGNAVDFGDLTTTFNSFNVGCSSSTRGIFALGTNSNVIQYITIATTGDAIDFGDTIAISPYLSTFNQAAACASSTRGVIGGGQDGNYPVMNSMQYITIASTGNGTSFGTLTNSVRSLAACSSTTRGIFAGGYNNSNVIQYITIATTGNATDFGDLLISNNASLCGTSSQTRGIFAGGGSYSNVIQYITIATTGNSTDFGDLTAGTINLAACSNAHGGL